MIIKNLSDNIQSVVISHFSTPTETYNVSIQPKGFTEIPDNMIVRNLNTLEGSVVVDTKVINKVETHKDTVDEPVIEADTPEELVEDSEEEEKTEVISDKFICDICGAEFASERGLNTHKNRVHSA